MLGALLGIGEQLGFERLVLLGRGAAAPRAGQRPDRHLAVAHAHQDLGAGARPARSRRSRDGTGTATDWCAGARGRARAEAGVNGTEKRCASTTWKMSPAAMYSLARSTMPMNSAGDGVGDRIGQRQVSAGHGCRVRQRLVERVHDAAQALQRVLRRPSAPRCRASGCTGVTTIISSFTASNTTMMVGRTNTLSGTSSASGLWLGRRSIEPHGVVAHVADDAGGDRRQLLRQLDARMRPAAPAAIPGRARAPARRRARRVCGRRLISALSPKRAPDDVGGDADDGVASAHGAALDQIPAGSSWAGHR